MSEANEAEIALRHVSVTVLVRAATGAIDLNEMAHYELAKRGFNKKGEVVGVQAAMAEWYECHGGATPRLRDFNETPAEDWEALAEVVK